MGAGQDRSSDTEAAPAHDPGPGGSEPSPGPLPGRDAVHLHLREPLLHPGGLRGAQMPAGRDLERQDGHLHSG